MPFPCPSPGGIFGISLLGRYVQKSQQSERSALIGPIQRYTSEQQLDGQDARLVALDNSLHDVGGQIGQPQQPADVGIA